MEKDAESAAQKLRRALNGPVYNEALRAEVGKGQLDYEVYLKTQTLLGLQTPMDELVLPDEMLFQIVHQAQELWLKMAAYEASTVLDALDRNALFVASASLERLVAVVRCLGNEIRILETLPPAAFQIIRRSLGNGSGLESPGYSRLLVAAAAAWTGLERLLEQRHASVMDVYNHPDEYPDLHRLAEQFVDWDDAYQTWLMAHFLLVRRTIGIDREVRALDGFPTRALAPRMMKPLFGPLWDIRVEMTKQWMREGGFTPGEPRSRRDGAVQRQRRAYLPDEEVMSERSPTSVRSDRGPNSVRYWRK